MLSTPAPFPHVGAFALYADPDLPIEEQSAEPVRIVQNAGTMVVLSFPLRAGARGTRLADPAELIDPTPLTRAETVELADIERALRGTSIFGTPKRASRAAAQARQQELRATPLRRRSMAALIMASHQARIDRQAARAAFATAAAQAANAHRPLNLLDRGAA